MFNLITWVVQATWVLKMEKRMTGNCSKDCQKSDLTLNISAKSPRRFKAGAELASVVNLVDVDVDHQIGEDFEMLQIKIQLNTETCVPTVVVS